MRWIPNPEYENAEVVPDEELGPDIEEVDPPPESPSKLEVEPSDQPEIPDPPEVEVELAPEVKVDVKKDHKEMQLNIKLMWHNELKRIEEL